MNSFKVYKYFICDFYLVTSRLEGGPKSILESMACGIPLISTKVGMAPDIINHGVNGFLVDIDDVETLVIKACEIIENEKLKMKLSDNGLETVKDYTWSKIASFYKKKMYY